MKKKMVTVLLAAVMAASLAACGGSSSESSDTGSSAEGTEAESVVSEAEEEDAEGAAREITFEELTVVDNDECSIKITGIDPDALVGYTLKAEFENKSSDTTYMFSVESAAINGVSSDPFFASEVAAGKKSNEEISFTDTDLTENGIDDFTDIELTFRVYDSDDWTADAVAEETVHVYPYGEENATTFTREEQETDNVIVDNDYVTVIVTGYEEDSLWGYTANLYLVNKTDTTVMFAADNVSVNGYMIDPLYAESVPAGKCAFSSMSWYDDELEENGITTVNDIEFQLRAYNNDDWESEDFASELILLNPMNP